MTSGDFVEWDADRLGGHTDAFTEWHESWLKLTRFFNFTYSWGISGFQGIWEGLSDTVEKLGLTDFEDEIDVYEYVTNGLYPNEYLWILKSLTLRDAVSIFEVYVEKCLTEQFRQASWSNDKEPDNTYMVKSLRFEGKTPRWCDLIDWWEILSIDIETPEIKSIRELRNKLTHQRGELDGEEQSESDIDSIFTNRDWGEEPMFGTEDIPKEKVQNTMNILAQNVERIDRAVFEKSQRDTVVELRARLDKLIKIKSNRKFFKTVLKPCQTMPGQVI